MWERIIGPREAGMPALRRFWWQTVTPLAADTQIAREKFHIPVAQYYRQTTWKERLYQRIELTYSQEQERAEQEYQERQREAEQRARQGLQQQPWRG